MGDDIFELVAPQRVPSPCVNICIIDPASGWCIGCGRTGDEVEVWTATDDANRQAILDALPERMAQLRRT